MRVSEARHAIVDVLNATNLQGRWRVINAASEPNLYAPSIVVMLEASVRFEAMNERVARFTLRFYIDHAAEAAQYDELLDVLEEGGTLDAIGAAFAAATEWETAMMNPDGGPIEVRDELAGQIVAPYIDVPVDVWL